MFVHNFQGGVNLCGEKKFFFWGGGDFFWWELFSADHEKKNAKIAKFRTARVSLVSHGSILRCPLNCCEIML